MGGKRMVGESTCRVVCVGGMGRSGTSLTMKLLNLLGVYLGPPENLMQPQVDNPRGYWEHQKLTDLNEAILACLGGSWHEPPTFPPGWEKGAALENLVREARALIRDNFEGSTLWGWKDPRNSLTLPFWQELLPSMSYVICVRNPLDVASSLERRYGFPFVKSVDLWLIYTASAIARTAGKTRLFVCYEDYFQNPEVEVRRLADFLGTPVPAGWPELQTQIEAIVENQLWHHRSTLMDAADSPELTSAAKSLYFCLRALVQVEKGPVSGEISRGESLGDAINIFSSYAKAGQARIEGAEVAVREHLWDTRPTTADRDAAPPEGDKPLSTEQNAEERMEELAIPDTGERMIPDIHHDAVVYAEHIVRYLFASRFVAGKKVLDVASGVGYGSDMLKAAGAAQVVGVDRSSHAVSYGATRHATSRPDFLVGDAECLPLPDGRFDVVVAFEAIEHVPDYRRFLTEVKRVLHADGLFLVSTPNRGIYVEGNPFHTKEFKFAELDGILKGSFRHVETLTQDNWITSAILTPSTIERADKSIGGNAKLFKTVGWPAEKTLYLVGLCSDAPLPKVSQQVAMTNICEMRRYVEEIQRLGADVHSLSSNVAERDTALAKRDAALAEKDAALADKDAALATKDAALDQKDAALAQKDGHIANIEAALHNANVQARAALNELEQIRSSVGYRLLDAYRRRIRWLFPPRSWRALPYRALVKATRWLLDKRLWWHPWSRTIARGRRYARLATRSIRVIKTEGWRAFWRKAGRRLRRRSSATLTRSMPIDFQEWIARNEPDPGELDVQRAMAGKLQYRPLISIIVPTWNPPPDSLRQTIDSVLAQTYDHWELCIADGGSSESAVREMLMEYDAGDDRIRLKLLNQNLGISRNSNEALAMARGEFVAFLDHTDLLAPFALFQVVQTLNRNPGLDCIYSDVDLIAGDGNGRFNPLFKPEWSPDMLLSTNYLAHLSVIRKSLVDDLGGLRSVTDGAQDWDLLLRVSEKTDRFARIPKILYHWRADSTSALVSLDNKPYAVAAQERAVQEHLIRRGLPGHVVRDESGDLRIRWQVTGKTRVSIVIPTRHNRRLLKRCLCGIDRSTYRNWEILVVDTAGRNRAREAWYRKLEAKIPLRVLWRDEPFNFSAVNNFAAGQAHGDALLFLNDDTEALAPDWLEELVGWLEQPGIGVVGAQLLAEDGTIQHGGDIVGLEGFAAHLFSGATESDWTPLGWTRWYRNLLAVTGACMMVRKEVFDTAGRFDENFVLCGSDVELCFRIGRAGYRVVCTPYARVLHRERATRGSYDLLEDCFTSFWHYQSHLYKGDPYFNPNLSSFSSVPQLKHPDESTALAAVAPVLGRDPTPPRQGTAALEEETAALVEACQLSPGEVEATRQLHQTNASHLPIKSINWFIPDFVSPFYGGIHTIFRFAAHFQRHYGVQNRFIVVGSGPEPYIRSGLKAAFPELGEAEIKVCSLADIDLETLPEADASIATLWITAYVVSKFQRTKRKFYFVQDFEPIFYPAGTLRALAETTYRMGLYGIANTSSLKEIYESDFGGKAVAFTPCVDPSMFHPPDDPRLGEEPLTVFLYGRPGHWRNCYELAIAALRRLKERLKQRVRIVTAGSWVSSDDPVSVSILDNLGLLEYEETANLYRTCDVGLVLSVSKHPSYLPLELMASGVLVVSNVNSAGSWLLHDAENCILAEPTAESICEALERALLDRELRQRLTGRAVTDIQERHANWGPEIDKVYQYLCAPEAQ